VSCDPTMLNMTLKKHYFPRKVMFTSFIGSGYQYLIFVISSANSVAEHFIARGLEHEQSDKLSEHLAVHGEIQSKREKASG
jgi:glycerol dehydrogenase-like iron-containing ADH family enzyme